MTALGIAAADAVHALRHAAIPDTPSGQHGQGLPSSAAGIESAQGIFAVTVVAE